MPDSHVSQLLHVLDSSGYVGYFCESSGVSSMAAESPTLETETLVSLDTSSVLLFGCVLLLETTAYHLCISGDFGGLQRAI